MVTTLEIAFELDEPVEIINSGHRGIITRITISSGGGMVYYVSYWADGIPGEYIASASELRSIAGHA